MSITRNPVNVAECEPYGPAGYCLIPLHRWNDVSKVMRNGKPVKDKDGKPRTMKDGKRPLDSNWTTRDYGRAVDMIARCLREKRNVGVRLEDEDLVVDVDPRNGGNDGFAALCFDHDIDPADYPTVKTGSGGLHLYMKKPAGFAVLDTLKAFPGVEFKSKGRQVVAAGSRHPDGGRYVWHAGPPLAKAPMAPASLLEGIKRPERYADDFDAGSHTPEVIAGQLAALDATAFREHDDWLRLMMAVHFASGGEARDEFVEWSTSDPNYADDEDVIGRRWDSLHTDRPDGSALITEGTLNHILREHGAHDLQKAGDAHEDFEDDIEAEMEFEGDDGIDENWLPSPKNPLKSAKEFRKRQRPTLIYNAGDWLVYEGSRYIALENDAIRAELYEFLGTGFKPEQKHVGNMIDALRAVCHKAADAFAPPCWLDGEGPFPAGETLAFTDGLLHLATMRFEPPTPNFFTRNALSYSFDPFAPKPRAWLQFLKSIFEGSPGSADTLQEIFGYMLLPDTSLQKAFIWDSPPRGGKGTTGRVLQKLIGDHNCVSPGFKGLATPSILTSMIGKQAAIISDMRLSKSADLSSIMENLLRITGEDSLTFDRKYKDAWTGRLLVRFFIFTNLSLAVPDVSAALINRFIALRSFESFLGREDAMLESRLLEDLPGILLWAIEGWRRLKARGRFQQTPEGESMLQQMIDLASPIPSFLRECCELDPKASVTKDDLYAAWDNWANTKGVPDLAENAFARFLLAAGHGKIRDKRGSHEGRRFTGWQGVGLRMEFG